MIRAEQRAAPSRDRWRGSGSSGTTGTAAATSSSAVTPTGLSGPRSLACLRGERPTRDAVKARTHADWPGVALRRAAASCLDLAESVAWTRAGFRSLPAGDLRFPQSPRRAEGDGRGRVSSSITGAASRNSATPSLPTPMGASSARRQPGADYIPLWFESFVFDSGRPDDPGGRRRFGGWGGLSGESAEEVALAWSVAHLACVVPVQAATRSRITLVGRASFR
jgi:hypothetical protein